MKRGIHPERLAFTPYTIIGRKYCLQLFEISTGKKWFEVSYLDLRIFIPRN